MEEALEELKRARKYEIEKSKDALKWEKPSFHLTPPVGWMNDPNGFSKYQDEYHLFFQYHPYSKHWGPMHWGHSKTEDFIKWEQLPCAIAPDTTYDMYGCFSGTALQEDEKHILMYTSVLEKENADGSKEIRQTQSIAIGDGINYKKISQNPVITSDILPEESSKIDFRDPKIWKENNVFYAMIGSKSKDGRGQIALFSSLNITDWTFESIADYSGDKYGKMWECPDFFSLDEKKILLVSPQFMKAKELEFHNGNNTVYFVGTFDKETKQFIRGEGRTIDYGLDFYAPQTVEAIDGRRIMMAWLQSWDNCFTPDDAQWSGMMTIPREIVLKEGKLIQNPVEELKNYRQNQVKVAIKLKEGSKAVKVESISGREFDMIIKAEVKENAEFRILLAADEEHSTVISFDTAKNIVTTDRTYSGLEKDVLCTRSMRVQDRDGKIKLRIIMDKYSIEIFVNDGEQTMTSLIYTPIKAQGILFESTKEASVQIEKFDIIV